MYCLFQDSPLKNIVINYHLDRVDDLNSSKFNIEKWQLIHIEPCELLDDLYYAVVMCIEGSKAYAKLVFNGDVELFKIRNFQIVENTEVPKFYEWSIVIDLDLAYEIKDDQYQSKFEPAETNVTTPIKPGERADICMRFSKKAQRFLYDNLLIQEEAISSFEDDSVFTILTGNRICRIGFTGS